MDAKRILKRINIGLSCIWLISLLLIVFFGPDVVWILQIPSLIISVAFVLFLDRQQHLRLRAFACSLAIGMLALILLTLPGFYTKSYVVPFDVGQTWVPKRTPSVALQSAFFTPAAQIASLGGYSCNGVYGSNCSGSLYLAGWITSEVILLGSVIVGNKVSHQQFRPSKVNRN